MLRSSNNYLKHKPLQKNPRNPQCYRPNPNLLRYNPTQPHHQYQYFPQPPVALPNLAHLHITQMPPIPIVKPVPQPQPTHPIRMTSSPDMKINLNTVTASRVALPQQPQKPFITNISIQKHCSYESLTTCSTSTESLLSFTPSPQPPLGGCGVRSQENLMLPSSNTEYFQQQRRISMSNLMVNMNPFANTLGYDTQYDYDNGRGFGSCKKGKCYYNKFNTPSENSNNENTTILMVKIKVSEGDYRVFQLKKFDDLIVSLQKFCELNGIKEDMVKPIVFKIFSAVNKVYSVMNNKVGTYNEEYLKSIGRVYNKCKDKKKEGTNTNTGNNSNSKQHNMKIRKVNSFYEGQEQTQLNTFPKIRRSLSI